MQIIPRFLIVIQKFENSRTSLCVQKLGLRLLCHLRLNYAIHYIFFESIVLIILLIINVWGNYLLKEKESIMYDQEKIKKMKNHELAMEAYSMHIIINYLVGHLKKRLISAMNRLFLLWIRMKESIYLSFLHMEGVMWQQKSV